MADGNELPEWKGRFLHTECFPASRNVENKTVEKSIVPSENEP